MMDVKSLKYAMIRRCEQILDGSPYKDPLSAESLAIIEVMAETIHNLSEDVETHKYCLECIGFRLSEEGRVCDKT